MTKAERIEREKSVKALNLWKQRGYLTRQQYKTLYGMVKEGRTRAAMEGLWTITCRQTAKGV